MAANVESSQPAGPPRFAPTITFEARIATAIVAMAPAINASQAVAPHGGHDVRQDDVAAADGQGRQPGEGDVRHREQRRGHERHERPGPQPQPQPGKQRAAPKQVRRDEADRLVVEVEGGRPKGPGDAQAGRCWDAGVRHGGHVSP